jgi:hypothetical protein
MKQSPQLSAIQERMQPGRLTLDGFLGSDPRSLTQILDEDANAVRALGLTHEEIAERMRELGEQARKGLGTSVIVRGVYEVRIADVRGVIPCPWGHPGTYPKTNVSLRNLATNDELAWTALSVHMVRDHGFYQGRGSRFRVDPPTAARALGLSPH